jgi:hypothetical protein
MHATIRRTSNASLSRGPLRGGRPARTVALDGARGTGQPIAAVPSAVRGPPWTIGAAYWPDVLRPRLVFSGGISRCCPATTCRKIRSPVRRVYHVFASLKPGTHDLTLGWDQAMERHHSNTIAPTTICRQPLTNPYMQRLRTINYVDSVSAEPRGCGPSSDDRSGDDTPAGALAGPGACHCHDPFRYQLHAIRRRLWILRATLEALPAKIELACRQSGAWAGAEVRDRLEHHRESGGDERLAIKAATVLGRWSAERMRARLRSRAEMAERRAAVAINRAANSLRAVHEAVLAAALARAKADEACRCPRRAESASRCD